MVTHVVILLGPPGAGKGTQAARAAEHLGLPHVATGDLFRENLSTGSELGRRAREYMDSGRLVPDELVLDMLFERVSRPDCEKGYVLDGFPRTLVQARSLDTRLGDDVTADIVDLVVPREELVRRAAGRLVCSGCGRVYHQQSSPPAAEGRCDACGGTLERRADDDPDVVRERLQVYERQTRPVLDYYRESGRLCSVDGSQSPDEVFESLNACMRAEA